MDRSPILVVSDTPLIDAISRMGQSPAPNQQEELFNRIVLVTEDSQLVGIVTERDILRFIALGIDLSQAKVAQVMTHPVITLTLSPQQDILTAWLLMRQHQIRHLPMISEQGQVLGLINQNDIFQWVDPVALFQEMRDRQTFEADLRRSEQKFRAIFDSTFQFIGLLTPEGILTEANRTALEAIGASLADVIGKPFWLTPWWIHSPALQTQLQQAVMRAAKGELVRFEAEHILADGSSVFVDFSLKPIFDEAGTVVMLIPEGRDIGERKAAEVKLQQQKQDLARSNAELQKFAYVASHDLQEPLRMITSYLELLERRYKGQLDDKADQFIAYAVDGAARMQALIQDLLNYSRVGTRGQDFNTVDCTAALNNALRNLQLAIAENNAIITHDPLPQVHGDATQLTQLFQNLISNAIKFRRKDPPQIQISAQRSGDRWLFFVRDNGIGIEAQYIERIFVIFQRLHSRMEYPGTGMGLAICKKIVERHGGTLWVESKPNEGSAFYFTLPEAEGTQS